MGYNWKYPQEDEEERSPVKFALVVEDDPAIRDIVGVFLQGNGYRPLMYDSAEAALAEMHIVLKAFMMDVVIVDIALPLMNGIEFIKELDKRHRRNAPVVIMSATSPDKLERYAQEIKADAAFHKPFKFGEFVDKIDKLVEERKQAQRAIESM